MKCQLVKPLILVCALSGVHCATIIHGTTQDVPMTTTPSGVRVFVNGEERGVTPIVLTLKRGMNHQIVFKPEGREDVVVNLDRDFDGGNTIVGNLFSWSLLGLVVDIADGAAYSLSPKDVFLNLTDQEPVAAADELEDVRVVLMTKGEYGSSQRNAYLLASIIESNTIGGLERELPHEYRGCRYVTAIYDGRWGSAVSVKGELRVVMLPDASGEDDAHQATRKQIDRYLRR